MNPRLNQIIAVVAGKKTRAKTALTDIYHALQKKDSLEGIARHYRPKDETGDQLPGEEKAVQLRVRDAIEQTVAELTDLYDVVLTQDVANCTAKANVVADDKVIAPNVPVRSE